MQPSGGEVWLDGFSEPVFFIPSAQLGAAAFDDVPGGQRHVPRPGCHGPPPGSHLGLGRIPPGLLAAGPCSGARTGPAQSQAHLPGGRGT